MPSSASAAAFTPLALSQTVFLGLVWGSTWVSFFFVLFRGYLRLKTLHRLYIDDLLVFLAWFILFITAIIWQERVNIIYYVWNISDGAIYPPPADLFEKLEKEIHQGLAVTILNFVSLWCIKFAFLVLFKKLGRNVAKQKILWWTVLVFTIATLVISIGVQAYQCVFGDVRVIAVKCAQPSEGRFIRDILWVQAAVDVASDIAIILIPLALLSGVQMNLRIKVELVAVFCLIILTMIIAIVKVGVSLQGPREDDSWLFAWSAIESAVAIIVACLVSYRASINNESRKKRAGTSAYPLKYVHNSSSSKNRTENEVTIHGGKASFSTLEEGRDISAPHAIHIRQEYEVMPYL